MTSANRQSRSVAVFSDAALADLSADALHRASFVRATARVLMDVLGTQDSVVAALVAPWGSGKSSTLAFLQRQLDQDGGVVIPVNTWMVDGPDAVAQEVVTAVTAALSATGVHPHVVKASRSYFQALTRSGAKGMGTISGALAEHFSIPMGPELGAAAGDVVTALVETATSQPPPGVSPPTTLQQAATALSKRLSSAERGVLVVIDDVDRLQPAELLTLFKAVRLLGRLPHVHYLLAYDENTLLDLLTQTPVALGQRDRALAYLEKVVPLRFEQPEISDDHIDDLLAEGYRTLKDELRVALSPLIDDAFGVEAELLLRHVLITPRTLHRYFAQLRLTIDLVGPTHVDVIDLAVLTLFRLHHPQLYRVLSSERRLLTDALPSDADERAEGIQRIDAVTAVPDGVSPWDWAPLAEAVIRLFPRAVHAGEAAVDVHLADNGRPQRVADPDFVDRYFALSPLPGDLGDLDVRTALRALATGQATADAQALLAILSPERVDRRAISTMRRLLRRATDAISTEPPTPAEALVLIEILINAAPLPHTDTSDADQPASVLIGHLISLVGSAGRAAWAALVTRTQNNASLRLLVRAYSAGVPVTALSSVMALQAPLVDEAWNRTLQGARTTAADDGDAFELSAWVLRTTSAEDLMRRIDAAVETGIDLLDLVAQLLPLRRSRVVDDAHAPVLTDDPAVLEALVTAVGTERIREMWAVEELAALTASPIPGTDEAVGLVWSARRRAAATVLSAALSPVKGRLPEGELLRTTLPGASAYGGAAAMALEGCDLRLVMVAAAPADALPLAPLADGSTMPEEEGWTDRWEEQVGQALDNSPVADWLSPSTQRKSGVTVTIAGLRKVSWIEDLDPGHRATFHATLPIATTNAFGASVPGGEAGGARTVFFQAMPGTGPASTSLQAAIVLGMGVRLPRRSPPEGSGEARDLQQVADPMTLRDLAEVLVATLQSARLVVDALAAVPGAEVHGGAGATGGVVHLHLQCDRDIANMVTLDLAERKRSAQQTQFYDSSVTTAVHALARTGVDGPGARHARRVLAAWLREAGYRAGVNMAVDAAVSAAVDPPRQSSPR